MPHIAEPILQHAAPAPAAKQMMKALVLQGINKIGLVDREVPRAGIGQAVIRVTLTTICGTDVHIMKGEYRVSPGLTLGHEAVGVIHELGPGVLGYEIGDRVLIGAITPCGQCHACLDGNWAQCCGPVGGWKFGNTMPGAQAEYLLVPDAQANLAKVPQNLSDEDVILLADIASTGISASERAPVRIGDFVAVFATGPVGLCAIAGAKLHGASAIIAVDTNPRRLKMAQHMGADITINPEQTDPVGEITRITRGRGVDVAIEALGAQGTFESCLRVLRPAGTLSSLGVYSGNLTIPAISFDSGLGNHRIITTLCPGGKERMRRLMELVAHKRLDLTPLLTHRFAFDQIVEAYDVFSHQRDGVLKVAIRVSE